MAATHSDRDATAWMESLTKKAEQMLKEKRSLITAGTVEETPKTSWKRHGVHVTQMPDDEHGILRISIGGGDHTPVALNYCTFRGEMGQCVDLLRKALRALEDGPE